MSVLMGVTTMSGRREASWPGAAMARPWREARVLATGRGLRALTRCVGDGAAIEVAVGGDDRLAMDRGGEQVREAKKEEA